MGRRREQINRSRRFSTGGLYSRGVVRTRGFVPVSPPSEAGGAPSRTRGAVRTRDAAVRVEPWQELKPEELSELLEELRDAQEGFPITIVVENPQAPEAQAFLKCLHAEDLLAAYDALWVVGEGVYEQAVPEALRELVQQDAYLNAEEEEQKTLADTLVPDLVFVADANAEKLEEGLAKWERRVLAVVLAGPDDFAPSALYVALGIPSEKGDHWRLRWATAGKGIGG